MDAFHARRNYARLDGLRISLRYAMRTLGSSTGFSISQPICTTPAMTHCELLSSWLSWLAKTCNFEDWRSWGIFLRVNRHQKEQNRPKGTKNNHKILSERLGLPSRYPYVAKVTIVLNLDIRGE